MSGERVDQAGLLAEHRPDLENKTINTLLPGTQVVNPAMHTPNFFFTPEEPEEISAGVAMPGREAEQNSEVDSSNAAEPTIVLSDRVESADSGITDDQLSFEKWASSDWAKSGITPEVAQQLGFRCVREDEICDILGFRPRTENGICEGYAIPFIDPETRQPMLCPNGRPYIRIRMRYPAILNADRAKYLSPKQAGQHAFIQAAVHRDYIE
jgi:hypothetical protein